MHYVDGKRIYEYFEEYVREQQGGNRYGWFPVPRSFEVETEVHYDPVSKHVMIKQDWPMENKIGYTTHRVILRLDELEKAVGFVRRRVDALNNDWRKVVEEQQKFLSNFGSES